MRTGRGLIPQWRRALAAGGLLGVVMLAVPVLVATAIGLGGGVGTVTEGLAAVATGPSEQAPSDVVNPADSPERSAARLAEETAAPDSAPSQGRSESDSEHTGATQIDSPGGTVAPQAPSAESPSSPGSQSPGSESPALPEPPPVDGTDGGAGGGGLLDGLGDSLNGLLGG